MVQKGLVERSARGSGLIMARGGQASDCDASGRRREPARMGSVADCRELRVGAVWGKTPRGCRISPLGAGWQGQGRSSTAAVKCGCQLPSSVAAVSCGHRWLRGPEPVAGAARGSGRRGRWVRT